MQPKWFSIFTKKFGAEIVVNVLRIGGFWHLTEGLTELARSSFLCPLPGCLPSGIKCVWNVQLCFYVLTPQTRFVLIRRFLKTISILFILLLVWRSWYPLNVFFFSQTCRVRYWNAGLCFSCIFRHTPRSSQHRQGTFRYRLFNGCAHGSRWGGVGGRPGQARQSPDVPVVP